MVKHSENRRVRVCLALFIYFLAIAAAGAAASVILDSLFANV